MSELTSLIQRARLGDAEAGNAAFGLLYEDLRKLARARLARNRRSTLLDTTALVNEAYLRLARAGRPRAPRIAMLISRMPAGRCAR